jgi:hypothetical protein
VTISATYRTVTKTAVLTVRPVALSSFTVSPASVKSGVSAAANRVFLDGPAPAGGTLVTIISSAPSLAIVPAQVMVPAGATYSAYFSIQTTAVVASTPVTITATYSGVNKTATLTVTP